MPQRIDFILTRPYKEIEVGDVATISKTISEADVMNYAGIIADFNPIHVNEEVAKESKFGRRLVHGMLTASFIGTLLGRCMPGTNGVFLSTELKFLKPVFIGDTITAHAEVIEKNDEKQILTLRTYVTNQNGEIVIDGKSRTKVFT